MFALGAGRPTPDFQPMFHDVNTGNPGSVGRTRLAIAVLLVIGAAGLGVLLAAHAGQKGGKPGATPPTQSGTCESRLLHDWADGRIDGVYPLTCYRAALRSLPADLEVYSSAHDDIVQALSERIVLSHHPQKISGHQGAVTPRKIASAP